MEKIRFISNFKILIFTTFTIRIIKFIFGIALFFMVLLPFSKNILNNTTNNNFAIFNTNELILLIIWIVLAILNRILLVVYIVKVFLANEIFISKYQNPLIVSKFWTIKTTAIIGFFLSFVDIISMILFLLLILRHKKELIDFNE